MLIEPCSTTYINPNNHRLRSEQWTSVTNRDPRGYCVTPKKHPQNTTAIELETLMDTRRVFSSCECNLCKYGCSGTVWSAERRMLNDLLLLALHKYTHSHNTQRRLVRKRKNVRLEYLKLCQHCKHHKHPHTIQETAGPIMRFFATPDYWLLALIVALHACNAQTVVSHCPAQELITPCRCYQRGVDIQVW